MTIPTITMIVAALVGVALHIFLKFRKDPEPNFLRWGAHKESWTYVIYSVALCIAGLLFAAWFMEFAGMIDADKYAFFLGYGGGHSVAQAMEQKAATPTKPKEVTEALDKPVP